MDRGRMMRVVGGIVMIMVAFLMFPMVIDGAQSILDANTTNLTGLDDIVGIGPTVIFLGLIFGGGLLSWTGLRSGRGQ